MLLINVWVTIFGYHRSVLEFENFILRKIHLKNVTTIASATELAMSVVETTVPMFGRGDKGVDPITSVFQRVSICSRLKP